MVFVSREPELAKLYHFLDLALAGKGQLCFITGEPGQGKTTLALEFARRAQEASPDLITAVGVCDPQTGQGDPYLPFRTMLQTLTDTSAVASSANQNQATWQRLVQASTDILLEWGPDLVGTFVPGAAIFARLGRSVGKQAGLAEKMARLVGGEKRGEPVTVQVDQSQIFQQYANVITRLSTHLPLLLILDDAQWADSSSIDLLFALVRRIQASRILLLVTYRETELELGRQGERHPLTKVVVEARRYLGDITIDLAQSQGRAFIEAYLDSEPNGLGEEFRAALFRHTGGSALFVVELLRALQDQGILAKDEAGRWQASAALSWNDLPDRAEAVIEERVSRLPDDLRQLLQAASVQGEYFAGEVVAQVQNTDARPVVQRLNSELVRRHRLLRDQGQERVGMNRLSRFAFQNQLFQQYLYRSLNQAERSYLHEDIAHTLEAVYGEQSGEVAVQLAWHYREAGLLERARSYLKLVGRQAAAQGAPDLAITYYSQALELTQATEREQRCDLLLARVDVYHVSGQREAERADLATLTELATTLANPLRQSDAALRRARYLAIVDADYTAAAAATQEALVHAERAGDLGRQAAARRWWGEALWRRAEYAAAQQQLSAAVDLARQAGDVQVEAEALRQLGLTMLFQGGWQQAKSLTTEALILCRQLGDADGEGSNLNNLGEVMLALGRYEQAQRYLQEAMQVALQRGVRILEPFCLFALTSTALRLGQYILAERYAAQRLQLSQEMELRMLAASAWGGLGEAHLRLGQVATGLEELHTALETLQEVNDWAELRSVLLALGDGLLCAGQVAAAAARYRSTLAAAQARADPRMAMFALAGLLTTSLELGAHDLAAGYTQELLTLLATHPIDHGLTDPAMLFLAAYQGLVAAGDERAPALLQAGYQNLMAIAATIETETLRQSLLENVPANRELLALCQQHFPQGLPAAPVDLAALFPPPAVAVEAPAEVATVPLVDVPPPPTRVAAVEVATVATQPPAAPAAAAEHPLRIDLRGAGLAGALLNARNLAGWLLAGADLSRAQLRGADLQGADLRGADLHGSDLRGAKLLGADLRSTDLRTIDLRDTDLDRS